jgi:hypothetical protein
MRVKLIDADLWALKNHRFPNLALMKISGWHKDQGDEVSLALSYADIGEYDRLYLARVFTQTKVDEDILKLPNLTYGGTGFYYPDPAPPLPDEIEHHMPDYRLYDGWLATQDVKGRGFRYYTDYSIGYTTRGCFRGCSFCVNRDSRRVVPHSPVAEFLDPSRKRICLLDDNVLGCRQWREILAELKATKKPFQFKQGMDIRLLTDEKVEALLSSKYDEDYIFAFDDLADKPVIEEKLTLWRKYNRNKGFDTKLYLFCGYDRTGEWNNEFWKQDLLGLLERIEVLIRYRCKPYVMRYADYEKSPLRGMYINIAQWCNQPQCFCTMSLREWCREDDTRKGSNSATYIYLQEFERLVPEAAPYLDMRMPSDNQRVPVSSEEPQAEDDPLSVFR